MRAVVGVTDDAWASYLRDRPELTEANFWLPSARSGFAALPTGGPFLFKTHWPDNQLVGGGFFSGYARFRVSEAWDLFAHGNGVGSSQALLEAITGYRKGPEEADPVIGCVLLRDLFFVPRDRALEAPSDFAKSIVRFKGYDLEAHPEVSAKFEQLLGSSASVGELHFESQLIDGPTLGLARLVQPRVGQQAFKGLVMTGYQRRCAITGGRIAPTLQAAHIRPVSEGGQHRLDNGLLLRADVHTMYDRGYVGIDERYRLHVSPRLREEFGNGAEFYEMAGTPIVVPERRADRPDRTAVTWHMDTVFKSA